MSEFRFKRFSVKQDRAALKVGTDAVLLGAAMTLPPKSPVPDRPLRILDIGTGTGVIALMAAQRIERDFAITAIDIDGPSVEDALENFGASPWADGLDAECISLQDFSGGCGEFDLIFSNPPFYDNSLRNPSERESAARHTTDLSWRDILAFAAEHLRKPDSGKGTDGGTLSLILPAEEEKRLLRTAASFGLFPFRLVRISTVPTKPSRRLIAEFGFLRSGCIAEESLILQDNKKISAEYSALTKEFYL